MKKIKYIIAILLIVFVTGCTQVIKEEKKETKKITGDYNIGETFSFMNFDITIGNITGFLKIDKELSNDHGKEIFKVPISVTNKNKEAEHFSMFYYKMYNPEGKEILSKGSYYDDALDYAPDLEPNDSYDKYLYIPYEGDGSYLLEFNNFSNKVKIVLDIFK